MKKTMFRSLTSVLIMAVALLWTACSSSDDPTPQSFQLTINTNLNDGLTLDNISSLQVKVTNDKGQEQTVDLTESTTTLTVIEGQYQLVASGKVKDEAAAYVSGKASVDVYGANQSVVLNLDKVSQSPIIFKSLYTTGGKQGYVVDQYYEIVNNSDEVQYLDQLMLSAPQGNQKTQNAWQANGYTDIYDCGQGMVIAFPGTGKDYPLQPGQSIVLANNAVNHKDLAGDGNNCPDLSKADWEVYQDYVEDVDYPAPNVNVIFYNNAYMKAFGLGFFGRAYVIARCPEGMTPEQFAADKSNIMTTPASTAIMEFLMIPSKYVLDAVDIWDATTTEHYGTFLSKDDAQGVLASTAWAGKCVRRKVTKVENGRAYYQDTNNSANDFLNNQELTPGQTPTKAD